MKNENYIFNAIKNIDSNFSVILTEKSLEPFGKLDSFGNNPQSSVSRSDLNPSLAGSMEMNNNFSLIKLFENYCTYTPHKKAVFNKNISFTYQDISNQINIIVEFFVSSKIQAGDKIGIYITKTIFLPAIFLACIQQGIILVILDDTDPLSILKEKIRLTGIKLIITEKVFDNDINNMKVDIYDLISILNQNKIKSTQNIKQTDLFQPIYIMFTSGSTGTPKGVIIPQLAMLNRFSWMWNTFPFTENEVMSQKTSTTFIDSIWEIFGGLLQGVPTAYFEHAHLYDASLFISYIQENNISRITVTPTYINHLLLHSDFHEKELPSLQIIILSGEPLLYSLAKKIKSRFSNLKIINLYGSTEVSGDVTYYEYNFQLDNTKEATVPIGRPVSNTNIYLLNDTFKLVPTGEVGEIYVSGYNLALGYIDSSQTEERFIKDLSHISEDLLFKTGDLAKIGEDGNLLYCGRIDRQIKFKGIRLETTAIENILLEDDSVDNVAVICCEINEVQQLIVFVSTSKDGFDKKKLFELLKNKLNERIIPNMIIRIDKFPLNSSGKINFSMLEHQAKQNINLTTSSTTAHISLEDSIKEILKEILNTELGLHDNFFENGLNSLSSMRILSRIRSRLQLKLSIHYIFDYPTIFDLSGKIRESNPQINNNENRQT